MEVDVFNSLAEFALDLRWSWTHAADEVWRLFDPTFILAQATMLA
jgi:starch phosphorylase